TSVSGISLEAAGTSMNTEPTKESSSKLTANPSGAVTVIPATIFSPDTVNEEEADTEPYVAATASGIVPVLITGGGNTLIATGTRKDSFGQPGTAAAIYNTVSAVSKPVVSVS